MPTASERRKSRPPIEKAKIHWSCKRCGRVRNCPTPVARSQVSQPISHERRGEVKRTESQHTQRKAHGVILVRNQEEHAIPKPPPNKHIRHDPRSKVIRVNRNSTNPVQRNKVPRKRSTHSTHMDRPRGSRVAEISQAEITKVEHEQEEREPEVRAGKEVNKAKEKKVVGDEVRAEVCSCSHVRLVAHVQGVCVAAL